MRNRIVTVVVLAVLAFVIGKVTVSFMKKPELYAGDRLEERTCRECRGGGKEVGDPESRDPHLAAGQPCIACKGKGKVNVILPGPEHPCLVKGVVFDRAAYPEDLTDEGVALQVVHERNPMERVPGGIAEARIEFLAGDRMVVTTSNGTGRFRTLVPPGSYKVSVSAPGFRVSKQDCVVPVLTEPIWLEEAHIVHEPQDEGQELTESGLPIRIPMVKN